MTKLRRSILLTGFVTVLLSMPVASSRGNAAASAGEAHVIRLHRVLQEEWTEKPAPPRRVSFAEHVHAQKSTPYRLTVDEYLAVAQDDGPAQLFFSIPIDTRLYNVFRVRLRVSEESKCRLTWTQGLVPDFARNKGAKASVAPGEAFQTVTLPLDADAMWVGELSAFRLQPAAGSTVDTEIAWMEFDRQDPVTPARLTLFGETHPALFGSQEPWEIVVPPNATLEFAMGMDAASYKVYESDGVRFECRIRNPEGLELTSVSTELRPTTRRSDRRWQTKQVRLAAYTGQTVEIQLRVDPLGSPTGDLAYWGNPHVWSRPPEKTAIPVVLVSCDTLRADHLSCYGYPRNTSPNLDAFADEAVLFEQAWVQDAWTLPSHICMLTGLYPKNHGVTQKRHLAEGHHTLAEYLQDLGYLTAAFTGAQWWLQPWRGYAQGFDIYSTPLPYRAIFETNHVAHAWIDHHSKPALFLFLHNYDIHSKAKALDYTLPYTPDDPEFLHFARGLELDASFQREELGELPASDFLIAANQGRIELTSEEDDHLIALYDDCVRTVDAGLHETFTHLRKSGLYEQALIIITSDHGEAFGEHGVYMHEQAYEHCARVPLIVRFPEGRFGGTRIETPVQSIDILPTVLDVLGIEARCPNDGQSLLALLEGSHAARDYAFTRRHTVEGIRKDSKKLLYDTVRGRKEFYDLAKDPQEQDRLSCEAVCTELSDRLERFLVDTPGSWRIRFRADDARRSVKMHLEARGGFFSFALAPRNRDDAVEINKEEATAEIRFEADAHSEREIVVRTNHPGATLSLTASCDAPLHGSIGATRLTPAEHCRLAAAPDDPRLATQPKPEAGETPSVALWRSKRSAEEVGAVSREHTDAELEVLEALGYLE